MALTTTESLSGKKFPDPRCDKCQTRSKRLTVNDMGQRLCDVCAPAKLVIGRRIE
jgi:hypothetical protein